jgi:cell filamentation protein
MKKPDQKIIDEFLRHSNWIEGEYSQVALEDARDAWKVAIRNLKANISVKIILEIHYELMKNIRPDIAGKLRGCNVWIGGQLKLFTSKTALKKELHGICKSMNLPKLSNDKGNPDELMDTFSKGVHISFEEIHPFEDGNGRTGRILYNLHRLKLGLPIHVIHQGDEQLKYYDWFQTHYA